MSSNAPYYNQTTVRFRDKAASDVFNQHTEEVFYDLTELYNTSNEQEREIQRMRKFFEIGSHFAQEQMDAMQRELTAMKEEIEALQQPGTEYIKTLFPADMRSDESVSEYERALIDTQHDVVTLPFSSYSSSKLFLYDDVNNEYILPNTLKYNITPKADNFIIKENSLLDALTPDNTLFWHREYTYFSGLKDYVEAQIEITLPDNIISSRDVNTIFIHPFPLHTMDIQNVEYQLHGGWKAIPGFTPIENAGNVRFCFSPLEMGKVRITLRQRNFIVRGNQHVFHMGIRQIGVSHNDYQTGVGRFEIPVTFNPSFKNKEITDIRPVYMNESALSVNQKGTKLTAFKVYEVSDSGRITYLSDTFPIQVKERNILIKGTLSFDLNLQAAPTLKSVELAYTGDS